MEGGSANGEANWPRQDGGGVPGRGVGGVREGWMGERSGREADESCASLQRSISIIERMNI